MSVKGDNTEGFNDRLEALRGIAALWVAVGHSLIWLAIGAESAVSSKPLFAVHGIQATVARLLITVFNGAAAVDVFFVLSGYVLARSLINQSFTIPTYIRFVVKRLFRIVPAFWLSLVVVCLYLMLIFPGRTTFQGATVWFNQLYAEPLTLRHVVDNVTLQSHRLNPNTWTLSVELLASLALPMIAWVIGATGMTGSTALLALTTFLAWKHGNLFGLMYLYMFVLGATISMKAQAGVAKRLSGLLVPAALAIVVLAGAFFPIGHSIQADILVSAGSGMLIWCIDAGSRHSLLGLLDSRSAQFLGRISYSFYLLHFIVLYALANLVIHHIPQWWVARWPLPIMVAVCIVSISLALPLSVFSFVYVEKPSTLVGRRLAARRWLPGLSEAMR